MNNSLKINDKSYQSTLPGFTIVELLVVIVVIGILAAVTIISYTGIAQKAKIATLQSDLDNSSRLIKLFQVSDPNGDYPTANNCPTLNSTQICLNSNSGNTFTYTPINGTTPKTFTLDATSTTGGVMTTYRITNDTSPVALVVPTGILSTLSPTTINTDSGPVGIAISTDGSSVYEVSNNSGGTISMYTRNSATGVLTAMSPATVDAVGPNLSSVTVSADGKSVYVATNNPSGTISMYNRNISTGLLTALSPATITASGCMNAMGITISADGNSVYAVCNLGGIAMYSRNITTGLLTALSPATIATGGGSQYVTISADGNSVYTTDISTNTISMYSRNTTTGALTALSTPTIATGTSPYGIAISADGKSVYVVNGNSDNMSMYSRNTTTGLLTALSPATIAVGTHPKGVTISTDGRSVYSTNAVSNNISLYGRNTTTGLLTALSPAVIAAGATTWNIVISTDGSSVYTTNYGSNNISMYSRN